MPQIHKEQRAAYMREYRRRNPEKMRAIDYRKHLKHRTTFLARKKTRYAEEPEYRKRAIERAKASLARNRDRRKAYMDAYYAKNREMFLAKTRDWKNANPERRRVNAIHYAHRRREMLANSPASAVASCKDFIAVERRKRSHTCYYCRGRFLGAFHIDHIIALSLGGRHEPSNLAVSCMACNLSKSDKPLSRLAPNGQQLLPI